MNFPLQSILGDGVMGRIGREDYYSISGLESIDSTSIYLPVSTVVQVG